MKLSRAKSILVSNRVAIQMKLGVLITYYNERTLLTECLESIAAQRPLPEEVLVFDDASGFPARDYVPPGLNVRVIRSETNIGPARGRNRLMRESFSDYIHFQDADDLLRPGWCEAVHGAMESGGLDLVLTEVSSTRDGVPYRDSVMELGALVQGGDLVRFTLAHAILPAAATYRRAFLLESGGYREDLWQSEDYELHIRLAALGARFKALTNSLVTLRVRAESRSRKLQEVWESRLQGLEVLIPLVPKTYVADLSDAFAQTGSMLYRLGNRAKAEQAFSQAVSRGCAQFTGQLPVYRWIARVAGPLFAERVARLYRALAPAGFRKSVRSLVFFFRTALK